MPKHTKGVLMCINHRGKTFTTRAHNEAQRMLYNQPQRESHSVSLTPVIQVK